MMRKSTLTRLLCLALLAALASFGVFTITAQPAQALQCFPTFLGCDFDHIGDFGNAICCVYLCPNGHTRTGACEQK
ncbi:MAG: hypothetical protein JF614_26050 [Acidobacteria bacterium]|jgi:hypothetical protein|nr:hypothetical protein [Acidobacteriota bacterium]